MEMKYFGLNLDDCFDELWHEIERVQDGRSGHTIAIKGHEKITTARELAARLVEFFDKNMYLSDEYGTKLDEN